MLLAALLTASGCAGAATGTGMQAPAGAAPAREVSAPTPPVATVTPRVDTLHGEVRTDDYFWMRDRNHPEVIPYLEAENRYTEAMMRHTEPLQEKLFQEIRSRIKETDLTVPQRMDDYYYYSRTEEGKQYPIYVRRRGSLEAPEELLLDVNRLAEGTRFFQLGAFSVSPDHRLLAFSTDTVGYEDFTLQVKDLTTGELLPDRIERIYGVAWANDNRTLFYTTPDEAKRPNRVWRHALGTPQSQDAMLFEEPDVLFRVWLSKTRSREYILVGSSSFTSSEVRYLRADRPAEALRILHPREPNHEYSVDHHGQHFYIVTNAEGATNFKLMRAPVSDPARASWREVLPHRESVLLDYIDLFRNHLVAWEREGGLRRVRVTDLRSGAHHYVNFPESVYAVYPGDNPEFDTPLLRLSYTSLITPSTVYDYQMDQRQLDLKKQTEVLGGYDPSQYGTERVFARARDGTQVPISIVYRKPLQKDGSRPLLLYAYGSYGASIDPAFTSIRLSLLDRGVVYAIAHIRGGQEMGRQWYEQGKMLQKMNTFTDFIDSAEHLIREGYTAKERLAIQGGSAGGLLMGVVVNLRPDLFRVVHAAVPFVDVINTMLDESIPLTAGEWEQWGDPRNPEHYAYMRRYSPYDNVERKAYPAMLVTTGLNDSRVAFWEPVKWVAKLRTMKTDDNPLLLKTNLGAGHGGASGRYDRWREIAFDFAFILDQLGIRE